MNLYITNFDGNKTPTEGWLLYMLFCNVVRFIVNVEKKYYPQIFLKQYRDGIKKKKVMNAITEELKLDESDDEDDKYDD